MLLLGLRKKGPLRSLGPLVPWSLGLVPCHPIAKELQARQYIEDRNKYRQQHRVNFRFVYADLCFIQALFLNSDIYPSDVTFLNRLWKQIDDLL